MQTAPALYTDFQTFAGLRKEARSNSPEAIKQVARQFESLFVQMMLKSMRDTVPENTLFGSKAERMYQDMYDKQISLQLSNGRGIGLAKVIERQLGGEPEKVSADRKVTEYLSNPRPVDSAAQSPVSLFALRRDFEIREGGEQAQQLEQSTGGAWQSAEDFIRDIRGYAQRAAETLGVDTEVLLAQSVLETGWGKYVPLKADGSNSFNLFGIKADQRWQGDRVEVTTREYRHGVVQQEKAAFRAYDSIGEAFEDYVQFIMGSPRYRPALERGYDAEAYARELQRAGYATDPNYSSKINRIRSNDMLRETVSELKNSSRVPLT